MEICFLKILEDGSLIRVPARSVSVRVLFMACIWMPSLLCLHMVERELYGVSSYEDTNPIGLGSYLHDFNSSKLPVIPYRPYLQIQSHWGFEFQHKNFEGGHKHSIHYSLFLWSPCLHILSKFWFTWQSFPCWLEKVLICLNMTPILDYKYLLPFSSFDWALTNITLLITEALSSSGSVRYLTLLFQAWLFLALYIFIHILKIIFSISTHKI